jgi:hypothetical protein
VLTDKDGSTLITPDDIRKAYGTMIKIYEQCNIEVILDGVEYISKPEYLFTTYCGGNAFFTTWHTWFSQTACSCCNQITVYFVNDMIGNVTGCAIPGDNWCRVDAGIQNGANAMAHEIGHLLLLTHSSDSSNFMYGTASSTATEVTKLQCCAMRLSPFVTNF